MISVFVIILARRQFGKRYSNSADLAEEHKNYFSHDHFPPSCFFVTLFRHVLWTGNELDCARLSEQQRCQREGDQLSL